MRSVALGLLTFIYVLNFVDRQLLSILAKPIQDELGFTDGQLGLLGGLSFALFYSTLAIPAAWLADRTNRTRVVLAACALWSAATMACGLATSYVQLALARAAVGVGEAGGVAPSYSLLSDHFAPEQRGKALAFFNLAPPVGQAVGVAAGAALALAFDWRIAFFLIGALGVVTALVAAFILREPARRTDLDAAPTGAAPASRPGVRATAALFLTRPVLLFATLAFATAQFVAAAFMNFSILFLIRDKGMSMGEAGSVYAPVLLVAVASGTLASGWIVDRFAPRAPRLYGLMPAAAIALALPFFVGFIAAPHWTLALTLFAPLVLLNAFIVTPVLVAVQNAAPADHRTLVNALLLLAVNLVGGGLGPAYAGAVSDWAARHLGGASLAIAFSALIPVYLVAIGFFVALAGAAARASPRAATRAGAAAP